MRRYKFLVMNLATGPSAMDIDMVDETLALLSGATVFSKVDANSGFWQIPLADESQHYTTFISSFGRYQFKKLPFGISSASEIFER